MGIQTWVIGGSDRRTRRFSLAGGRWRAGAVLAGLVLLGASPPASAQTLTWSVVPSPNRSGIVNVLEGVSCVSAAACTAVGGYETSGGANRTLVESWNGTRWSVVPSPNQTGLNVLYGVSCVSAAACTAVGYYNRRHPQTLIESWNGTSWSVVPSPNPGTPQALYGVSCVSAAACTAVGYYTGFGGTTRQTLIESWNGTRWSVVPSPGRSGIVNSLDGVSCVSAAACTAVGYGGTTTRTLVESWNGTSWTLVPSPNPGTDDHLLSVSCISAAACTAAGSYETSTGIVTLIESWNGTSWTRVPSPHPGAGSELHGVSCATASACTAVGNRDVLGGGAKTLIESGTASR